MARKHRLSFLVMLAGAAIVASSALSCASKCGSDCAPTEVSVWSQLGETLLVTEATWTGPACPAYPPQCRGSSAGSCERLGIRATAAGTCDLTIKFTDRPTFTVHAVFGAEPTQGCCKGFPVVGDAIVYVPPLNGGDAGTDGDAGGDASPDADSDAGAGGDAADGGGQ